jgi:hypothetical protein
MRTLPCLLLLVVATGAQAATYQVGPTRPRTTLQALFDNVDLEPGDIVEVDGDVTYNGNTIMRAADGGAQGNPVILRGIRVNGQRPRLVGTPAATNNNTIEFQFVEHVVFEGFDVTGTDAAQNPTARCIYHHGHDLTIRDAYVHDCPRQGILGADQDSGSITIEYSEIKNIGGASRDHAIYMATDEVAYPGAVFRLQYNWIHDSQFGTGEGGNLVKSRAERNEIYYNWLEDAYYHELELIGPDPDGAQIGWDDDLAREDSDVVGNVIVHTSSFGAIVRFGGDGTSEGRGESFGRYRFVNNTVIRRNANNDTPTVFRLYEGIDSLEFHNNVIWREGASSVTLVRAVEAQWVTAPKVTGTNNWVDAGFALNPSSLPNSVTGTITGSDPLFTDLATYNLIPAAGSPLLNVGNNGPVSPPGYEIVNPAYGPVLFPPSREPAVRTVLPIGTAALRPVNGTIDIGAYERANSDVLFANGFE